MVLFMPDSHEDATEASPLLKPRELAAIFRVSVRTLARYADKGDLPVVTLPSGHRRYRRADVERVLAGADS